MVHNSMLYTWHTPSEIRLALPSIGFQRCMPGVKPPSYDQVAVAAQPNQEACLPGTESGIQRVADSVGEIAVRIDKSGFTTVLAELVATLPGIAATIGRIVVHTTQTAETYHRVRQFGFNGVEALTRTALCTTIGRPFLFKRTAGID